MKQLLRVANHGRASGDLSGRSAQIGRSWRQRQHDNQLCSVTRLVVRGEKSDRVSRAKICVGQTLYAGPDA
jgi:hypothetical protein